MTIQQIPMSKMARITFQFMPEGGMNRNKLSIRNDSGLIKSIDKSGELTEINLSRERTIEIGPLGNIRYTESLEDSHDISYRKIYREAIDSIRQIIKELDSDYTVCLVLCGEDVSTIYLQEDQEIERFREEEFGEKGSKYTEIGDSRVKIPLSINEPTLKAKS